jgi:predicted O-methyltransferase YrrM
MPWWFAVAESNHELQNPTSAEKIRLLGRRLRLGPESHVLDMASGRGGPAVLLAGEFGCHITCVEESEEFLAAAQQGVRDADLSQLIELVHSDGRDFPLKPDSYDAALCLGASFIWDGLPGTLAALAPAVRRGGFVAVGEPYWNSWPLPKDFQPEEGEDFLSLAETAKQFAQVDLELVTLIASSQDDWDNYVTLRWYSVETWLHDHPDDPDAKEFREFLDHSRDRYLHWERDLLGWGIFVSRAR